MNVRVAVFLACFVPLMAPIRAEAQSRDPALATELFNAGRDLMKKGNYAAACPKLATSLSLDPKAGTMARLAECEEQVGQLVNARAHWSQAVNLARAAGDDRLPHIEAELRRLDGIVPKVDVELGAHPVDGATMRLDQVSLGSASFGLPVPVEPGAHVVVVSAPGKVDWTGPVTTVRGGGVTRVDVPALVDAPIVVAPPPAAAVTAQAPAPPIEDTHRTRRLAAWITGGGAVAALGLGAAFAIMAKNDLDDSNRNGCVGNNCTLPGYNERNDARTAGDVSTAMFIVGGALGAASITLALLPTKKEESVAVSVGPGALFVSGRF